MEYALLIIFIFSSPLIIIWILSKFNRAPKLNDLSLLKSGIIVFVICPIFTIMVILAVINYQSPRSISKDELRLLIKQCKIDGIGYFHSGSYISIKGQPDKSYVYYGGTNDFVPLIDKYSNKCGLIPSVVE